MRMPALWRRTCCPMGGTPWCATFSGTSRRQRATSITILPRFVWTTMGVCYQRRTAFPAQPGARALAPLRTIAILWVCALVFILCGAFPARRCIGIRLFWARILLPGTQPITSPSAPGTRICTVCGTMPQPKRTMTPFVGCMPTGAWILLSATIFASRNFASGTIRITPGMRLKCSTAACKIAGGR